MKATLFSQSPILSLGIAVALLASGCGQHAIEPSSDSTPVVEKSNDDSSHGGWWCVEHGIPEDACSMCSAKVADECKAKGDWCEEHNRAESQCFICHPEKAEKFAKLYEAKFGKSPPRLEDEE